MEGGKVLNVEYNADTLASFHLPESVCSAGAVAKAVESGVSINFICIFMSHLGLITSGRKVGSE